MPPPTVPRQNTNGRTKRFGRKFALAWCGKGKRPQRREPSLRRNYPGQVLRVGVIPTPLSRNTPGSPPNLTPNRPPVKAAQPCGRYPRRKPVATSPHTPRLPDVGGPWRAGGRRRIGRAVRLMSARPPARSHAYVRLPLVRPSVRQWHQACAVSPWLPTISAGSRTGARRARTAEHGHPIRHQANAVVAGEPTQVRLPERMPHPDQHVPSRAAEVLCQDVTFTQSVDG